MVFTGQKINFQLLLKIYFSLLPVERIFKKLEQNGFHWPENQFPVARIKNLL